MKTFKEFTEERCCDDCYDHVIQEAEYQGKTVTLNDPIRGGSKKFYVYVKNEKGNVVKVSFGDTTGLSIKRDDPKARKSFRARHNCDDPGPKWKARYWSCYQWRANAKVDEAQGTCWDGYEQRGMKKKGDKMVPNCVPVGEASSPEQQAAIALDMKEKGKKPKKIQEKNKPTNPELWSRAKSLAKQKFDVYPSAYANGWAAKWYKGKGGGWSSE